jgi:hypothetical protein
MYHAIRNNEVYDNLQNDLIKERWKWHVQQNPKEWCVRWTSYFVYVDLYVKLYFIDVLFICVVIISKYKLFLILYNVFDIIWFMYVEESCLPTPYFTAAAKLLPIARWIFGRLDLLHRGFRPKPAKLTPKNIFIMRHFFHHCWETLSKPCRGRLQGAIQSAVTKFLATGLQVP